jgi:outer membrane receptor protein involved in Fe transport
VSRHFAHGFAGDRFFPATISTDDPFGASELSLPTFSEIRQPGPPPVKVRFDVTNVFDQSYQLRNGTGIGVFAPQFEPRRGFFGGLSWIF